MTRKNTKSRNLHRTEPEIVDTMCALRDIKMEELADRANVDIRTVKKANAGGPSQRDLLIKLGKKLNMNWKELLHNSEPYHPRKLLLKFLGEASEGEEFRYLEEMAIKLMVNKSFAHDEVSGVARLILTLAESAKQPLHMGLFLLWQNYVVQGKHELALQTAQTMASNARTEADHVRSQRALGECYFYQGAFEDAMRHLCHNKVLNVNVNDQQSSVKPHALDHKSAALSHAGLASAGLGDIDRAIELIQSAITHSQAIDHVQSLVLAQHFDSVLSVLLNDPKQALQKSELVTQTTNDNPFPLFAALAKLIRCWASKQQGKRVRRRDVYEAFDEVRSAKGLIGRPLWVALVAQIELLNKDYELALYLIDDALEMQTRTGEYFCSAEIFRTKCLIFLARGNEGDTTRAMDELERAREVANDQQAILFQLQAALTLDRIPRKQVSKSHVRNSIRPLLKEMKGNCPDVETARKLIN